MSLLHSRFIDIMMWFQVKVREATSNDPWGPSSTLMAEIADLTYNVMAFTEIMQVTTLMRLYERQDNGVHGLGYIGLASEPASSLPA